MKYYKLYGMIRDGPNKGKWVMCWTFDDLETGRAFAKYRINNVPERKILIKDNAENEIEKVVG